MVVTDPLTPACDAIFASLAIGATETYTCQQLNVTADYTNTATVTTNEGATDSDTAQVTVALGTPSVTITKSPATQSVVFG